MYVNEHMYMYSAQCQSKNLDGFANLASICSMLAESSRQMESCRLPCTAHGMSFWSWAQVHCVSQCTSSLLTNPKMQEASSLKTLEIQDDRSVCTIAIGLCSGAK